jgi:predicted O-methyltransferase YrrM
MSRPGIRALLRALRDRFLAGVARKEDVDRLYAQVAGLLQIQSAMDGRPVVGPLRGWAISPDALAWILIDLQRRTTPLVVEFGSGQSTLILAAVLRHGGGRLVTVEHDVCYRDAVTRGLADRGLADLVDVIHAPLREDDLDDPILSYDTDALPQVAIDVGLVDGPPASAGRLGRLVPLRWATSHLAPGGTVFLDDANRDSEQECLARLARDRPDLAMVSLTAEKGLVAIRAGDG